MSSRTKKVPASPPRFPERKWGPFHGGVGVAVWLNEVEGEGGEVRYFRSITIAPRRYRDAKTGQWLDASSLRPVDLPSLMLALQAAHDHVLHTPLPGQPAEDHEMPSDNLVSNGIVE